MSEEAEECATYNICTECNNPHWQTCSMHDNCEAFKNEVERVMKDRSEK